MVPRKMANASVDAHLCCHEKSKEHAVLQQKVMLLGEQIKDEKQKAKMKEEQYNKIIGALERTAAENKAKTQASDSSKPTSNVANPSQKDWKDTLDELNKKKEEVNKLQEQVLSLQLREEKQALDHKLALQQKDDEIGEERLKFRHRESDLRQSNA